MGIMENIDFDKNFKRTQELSDIKHELRTEGLIPILSNNSLCVYKVRQNNNLREIIAYFEEEFYSIFEDVIRKDAIKRDSCLTNAQRIIMEARKEPRIINTRPASVEEVEKKFGLDDMTKRNEFCQKNALDIAVDVPLKDNIWVTGHRKERYEEVIDRIASEYIVETYKKSSKIARFLKLIASSYYNLDIIAEIIYEFYNNEATNFSEGWNIAEPGQELVKNMTFSKTESELSEEEKVFCIRKMLEGFDIECVFDSKVEDISNFVYERIAPAKLLNSNVVILDIAKHNSDIINDENISKIIDKVKETGIKRLRRK